MNHCRNCGTEFEGKFCPECGARWEDETVCPSCGAPLAAGAKFCSNCGYSFTDNAPAAPAPAAPSAGKSRIKMLFEGFGKPEAYRIVRCLPEVLLLLLAVLTFAFLAAPLMSVKQSLFISVIDIGNAYTAPSYAETGVDVIPFILLSIAFFTFAALQAILAFSGILQARDTVKRGFWKKGFRAVYLGFVCDVFFIFFASLMIAAIGSLDEGLGILSAGACPILMIVFPVLFAAGTIVALVFCRRLAADPAVIEAIHAEKEEKAARRAEYYATHAAPVLPENGTKAERAAYKQQKYCYDRALDRTPSKALIWLGIHHAAIIVTAVLLAIAILLLSILVPILSDKFTIGFLNKIELGATQEEVANILGEPFGGRETSVWNYYDDSLMSYANKAAEIGKQQESAMMQGDFSKLDSLTKQYESLMQEMQSKRFSSIEITFETVDDTKKVASVMLDKAYQFNPEEKVVLNSETKVLYTGEEETPTRWYYTDYRDSKEGVKKTLIDTIQENTFYYELNFNDGSYYRARLNDFTVDYHGNKSRCNWTDKFGSHEADAPNNMTIDIRTVGGIGSDGAWGVSSSERSSITTLALPDDVTTIDSDSFRNCYRLTSITIPASVTLIKGGVFSGCIGLESITVADGNQKYYSQNNCIIETETKTLVAGCKNSVIPDGVTSIGDHAFESCEWLTNIAIPNGISAVGDYAFCNCSGTSITIPDSVITIGNHAFENCFGLTGELKIPVNLTSIGNYAFGSCTGLTSVLWNAENCTQAEGQDNSIFGDCTNLKTVTFGETVKTIPNGAFPGCLGLTSITIPDSVTSIGSYAFVACSGLTSVTIGRGVTSIGNAAFLSCTGLANVLWNAENCTYVGSGLFDGDDLKTVTFGETVKSIPSGAFYGCSGLTSITIPDSVTSIGDSAFNCCTGLTSVTIGSGVTLIESDAFLECDNLTSVEFKNPNGWSVYRSSSASSGQNLSSTDLENKTTAAQYLRDTYEWYYWKRK